jgi:hypothetical protein
MKAKDVSVSLYDAGDGILKVWCASFTINGTIPKKDGLAIEGAIKKKQKEIAKLIEAMEFPDD